MAKKKKQIKVNDDQLLLEANRVADLYHQLTLDLFDNVVERVRDRGTEYLQKQPFLWQLEKMNELGLLNEDNVKLIEARSGVARELLEQIIYDEGYNIYKDTHEQLGSNGYPNHRQIQSTLAAYSRQAFLDLDNLINTTLPESVIGAYRGIVEKSVAKVATGMVTADRAVNDTVMEWFEKGFYGFTDKSGRHWKADNYARTVIKSTVARIRNEMLEAPARELGIDTFYYSVKATARAMCAPIQGKIVTTGQARFEGGEVIHALDDYGYGLPGGCLGINCGHTKTPFIPGVNKKPELDEDLKGITPEQAIENANVQAKQRALERSIRHTKEQIHVAKKLDDTELIERYTSKLGKQKRALKSFLDEHKFLYRDREREKYQYDEISAKNLYKSIDKHLKKEYSEILQNLGDKAPKSYSDFKALIHSEKESLRYDNRIINYFKGDIHEKLSEKQRQQAVEAYFNFKNDGIVFGDHAIARYIERMRRNDGTFTYNYETVKTAFSLPPNYVSEQNGRLARYYNGILYITEPDTDIVVTMMKRKKLKGFKPL
ncbi:phage minor capsid protein [Streptococcus suis]|uniref:phage minor capsid protein n=1 Tax=Streptococcus suis TaxID=1307 RepID=UPI00147958AF